MSDIQPITVSVLVHATPEQAWEAFTAPTSITEWNFASDDWHCTRATNDLREGGAFSYRMESRDGAHGFDFEGEFVEVSQPHRLRYSLGPDREVVVQFIPEGEQTRVSQSFTPDGMHPAEAQQAGWQAILENYKTFVASGAHGN
jgi:uncharacterized protein YndB with AHSA1/START domain